MNRGEALARLESENARERLEAARYLARFAQPADRDKIARALRNETVTWSRAALQLTLKRLEAGSETHEGDSLDQDLAMREVYAQAVEETTGRLVHELRPILGAVRFYGEQEFEMFRNSKTRRELDRLESMMEAIDDLRKAASAPRMSEFDLADALETIASQEAGRSSISVERAGPSPLIVQGDRALVELCVRNGLCNALEATEAATSRDPVVITWGETDAEYWVSILDRGIGLPAARRLLFEIGSTTKEDHLGMGLPLVSRAIETLQGSLFLGEREGSGTRFEFRWLKPESLP